MSARFPRHPTGNRGASIIPRAGPRARMDVPLFIVDAFTDRAFAGNPAAVCVLDAPLPEATMQAVAAEMNLSETAFVHPLPEGAARYALRWFTPAKEIPLCGHATLATAHVLLRERGVKADVLRFQTLSGELPVAAAAGAALTMDFPLDAPHPYDASKPLVDAVGARVTDARVGARSGNVLLRLPDEDAVRNARPDPRAMLAAADVKGVILTARASEPASTDFVSRYFTPWYGIDEDPVTGSSHTLLAPYWARELGKSTLNARQVSRRGGDMTVKVRDDGRVDLTGSARVVVRGTLAL